MIIFCFVVTVSHEYNSSLQVSYSHVGNDEHIHEFMKENYRDVFFPDYQSMAPAMRRDRNNKSPYIFIFADICEQLKGYYSLFTIYSNHLHRLPRWMVGPDIIAYESFLDAFEDVVRPYILHSPGGGEDEDRSFATRRLTPHVHFITEKWHEMVNWPAYKYIILHSVITGHGSTAHGLTHFHRENIQGLSDALTRLGMRWRGLSVSLCYYFNMIFRSMLSSLAAGMCRWCCVFVSLWCLILYYAMLVG